MSSQGARKTREKEGESDDSNCRRKGWGRVGTSARGRQVAPLETLGAVYSTDHTSSASLQFGA